MRVTKRIEGYIHDEVSKIAEIKREAIRAKYNDSMNEFKVFREGVEKECEILNQQMMKTAEAKGYKIRRYRRAGSRASAHQSFRSRPCFG